MVILKTFWVSAFMLGVRNRYTLHLLFVVENPEKLEVLEQQQNIGLTKQEFACKKILN